MKNNKKKTTLIPNQIGPGIGSLPPKPTMTNGEDHPPKNKTDIKPDIKIMFAYSPRKNKAKLIAEYSVLNPETKTDSSSGKSKGCRFVSAKAVTQNIKNLGNKGKTYHIEAWAFTIVDLFKDPAHKKTETKMNPLDTS